MTDLVERFKKFPPAIRYGVIVLIAIALVLLVLNLLIPTPRMGVFSNVLTLTPP